jgi:hypothetical protein
MAGTIGWRARTSTIDVATTVSVSCSSSTEK